mgnify:CR=1 FL=1
MLTLVDNNYKYSSNSKRKKKTKLQTVELQTGELRPLTTDELCRVNLSTFREGFRHCRWPKDVIEKFLAVQV